MSGLDMSTGTRLVQQVLIQYKCMSAAGVAPGPIQGHAVWPDICMTPSDGPQSSSLMECPQAVA